MTMFGSQWLANPDTGYEIDQSIRFNDDDAAYLYRDVDSDPTNGKKFTYSVWIKRGAITGGTNTGLLSGGSGTSTGRCDFVFTAGSATGDGSNNDALKFDIYSGSFDQTRSTAKLRDPSSWYHIVLVFDAENGTANNTLIIYLNGNRLELDSTSGVPNVAALVNANGQRTRVGADASGTPVEFDGYMAEINMVDGQALAPTNFGETNSDTGQWVPIKYSGSYGTNGFYIKGEDSSNLGNDSSGNNNDFTSTGLAAADQVTDSPTNNFCVLSPIDSFGSGLTLSDGNLRAVPAASAYGNNHGTFYINSGKWVFECKHVSVFGEACGWSPSGELTSGSSDRGYFMFVDGRAYDNVTNTGTKGASLAAGDFRYVFYDADAQAMWFAHVDVSSSNALVYDNSATKAEIEAGTTTNAVFTNIPAGFWAPGIWMDTSGVIEVNFGQSAFATTSDLPSGFNTLSAANLSDPTIADPKRYFGTLLYTGNGTTGQTVTGLETSSGTSWTPDWVWIKPRSAAYNSKLFDSVRTLGFSLESSTANAQADLSAEFIAFADGGFQVDDNGGNNINQSGITHVAWNWEAGGSGGSNGDGATSSTVSANSTAGFSITKWTGTGSATTLGHGLGSAPKMIWVKNLADADSWVVYHEDVGNTKGLTLDTTSTPTTASTFFNNTSPTSSVFTVGSGGRTNGSSDGMIAYVFSEIPGYSKISSYVGNGSTDGSFVFTGFKPAFLLIKNIDASESWNLRDSARDPINVTKQILSPDSNATESTSGGGQFIDLLSNGFKCRGSDPGINSSATFIYMAFAEIPFKTGNAR